MLSIAACISFNVLLAVIFRGFARFQIDNLLAITINYFVAAAVASLYTLQPPWSAIDPMQPWLIPAVILGLLLILGFTTVAYTIQHFGIGMTAVFQKVSLLVTALFAIFYFQEAAGWAKLLGIPLAVLAIYLINQRQEGQKQVNKLTWLVLSLPLLTFLFNGSIDTLLFWLEETERVASGDFQFISSIFFAAGLLGTLIFVYRVIFHQVNIEARSILGGIVLGIPNFFSIHFFLLALGSGFDGSIVVPINNAGIILLSAVVGHFFFAEAFSRINLFGIVLAVTAILLLALPI